MKFISASLRYFILPTLLFTTIAIVNADDKVPVIPVDINQKPVELPPVTVTGKREIYDPVFPTGPSTGTGGDTGGDGSYGPDSPSKEATAPPAANSNSETTDCPQTSKNPVILATGEKIKHELDFSTGSMYGLGLSRTYKSRDVNGGMFGSKWRSSYDYRRLAWSGCYSHPDYPNTCIPTTVTFTLPDGASYTYTKNPYDFSYRVKSAAATGTLYYEWDSTWTLVTEEKIYTFAANGLLQKIETPEGALLQRFTYDAGGFVVVKVTNAAGQAIDFTWSNNRVVKARGPSGYEWTYGYTSNGMLSNVTTPGSPPDVRTYHYEHSGDATLLTGITVNGSRYSTYKFTSTSVFKRAA
jgi:hypothetical protein